MDRNRARGRQGPKIGLFFSNHSDAMLLFLRMRRVAYIVPLVLIVALFLFRSHLIELIHPAPVTYPTTEAAKQIGHYDTIVGKVAEVSMSQKGTVFIDFDAAYPKQTFTAVIPARDVGRFAGLNEFRNRQVGVTGRLDLYNGKPEIVVNSPQQLKIIY